MYYRQKRGYEKTRFVGLNIDSRFAGAEKPRRGTNNRLCNPELLMHSVKLL